MIVKISNIHFFQSININTCIQLSDLNETLILAIQFIFNFSIVKASKIKISKFFLKSNSFLIFVNSTITWSIIP